LEKNPLSEKLTGFSKSWHFILQPVLANLNLYAGICQVTGQGGKTSSTELFIKSRKAL